jgi:hypothetical protein
VEVNMDKNVKTIDQVKFEGLDFLWEIRGRLVVDVSRQIRVV